jgi:hypothetical protein
LQTWRLLVLALIILLERSDENENENEDENEEENEDENEDGLAAL